jgi:hypothetical protein
MNLKNFWKLFGKIGKITKIRKKSQKIGKNHKIAEKFVSRIRAGKIMEKMGAISFLNF